MASLRKYQASRLYHYLISAFRNDECRPSPTRVPITDKTDSVWTYPEYENQLYDGLDCLEGCDVTTGTPIAVDPNEAVTGIDYELRVKPLFEDGFECGSCERWSAARGLI
jgi:hypothetical protein